jgi:hypothetical protein
MPQTAGPAPRLGRATAAFLLGAAAFSLAYGQAPLYYSNQNQYFLHGLARASHGLLGEDWLANTRDPTPVFSALVTLTARRLAPAAFYLYYALLLGAYAAVLLRLFASVAGAPVARRRWPAFLALLLAAHAALPRWLSYRWLGQDYPWFLQAGVAGQYVLGAMFQPSTFGVLLVVAACLFVQGRLVLTAACVGLAATFHPTYLLPGTLLTLGFLAALVRERRYRQALALGALALALVLPVTAYVLVAFTPTSPAAFAQAQAVLVDFRIPHHARPDRWLDLVAVLQLAWLAVGLALARPARLFLVLAVPALLSVLLTLAQVATGSDSLALLFPWRVSAVLMPLATTVILARLVAAPGLWLDGRPAWLASGVAVAALVAGGLWITATRQAFHADDEELPLLDFVRRSKEPGDVYFLPVTVPDLMNNPRGSLSSDFKPLADKRRDRRVIPVDLQRFRLGAGAPIFVDFKSVPYKDVEVLAWRQRIGEAQQVQAQLCQGRPAEALAQLRRLEATHLVLAAGQATPGGAAKKVYEDDYYLVYDLRAAP